MSDSQPVRSKSRRRLVAACTAGILSLGALALGTSAQAAAPGAHPNLKRPRAAAVHVPHIQAPKSSGKSKLSAKTALAQTPAPQRYDADNDGQGDQLYRGNNGDWYNSLATEDELLGASQADVDFLDAVTPGNIDGSTGSDVLGLTADGSLQLFSGTSFPNYPSWTGKGWNIYNKVVAVDDITGDGKPDVVARTFDGQLYLYAGTGNGSAPFAARVLIGAGWGGYDQLTGAGDLNNDGISDLVARDGSGNLYFYAGTGSAAAPYAARALIGGGWNIYNQIIGLGNNAGGTGVLWARTSAGELYGYQSNGAGGFAAPFDGGAGFNNVELMAGFGSIPYWGKKELFGLTSSGSLFWYYPDNAGKFSARQQVGEAGDWKGADLVFANALTNNGVPSLLERDGGTLANLDEGAVISTGWSGYNLILGPGDLSGDGKGDLLGRDTSGHLYLFRGTGSGTDLAARQLVGAGWGGYNAIVGAGDVSGDGRADIIARDTSGGLYLYKGTGNAAAPFAARVKIGTGYQIYNKLASAGDIDGDGRADLLGVDSAGTLYRYSATGTGQLKARVSLGGGWNTYAKLF